MGIPFAKINIRIELGLTRRPIGDIAYSDLPFSKGGESVVLHRGTLIQTVMAGRPLPWVWRAGAHTVLEAPLDDLMPSLWWIAAAALIGALAYLWVIAGKGHEI